MSYIKQLPQKIDTRDPDWPEDVVEYLLEGEPVLVCSGTIGCLIPGGRISGPVWRHARRYLKEAGVRVPRLRRSPFKAARAD
jgi:hypothetical protein